VNIDSRVLKGIDVASPKFPFRNDNHRDLPGEFNRLEHCQKGTLPVPVHLNHRTDGLASTGELCTRGELVSITEPASCAWYRT